MIKIFEMGKIRDEEIFARFEPTSSVEDIVKGIIARVRAEGDAALRAYSAEFDHVEIEDFLVSEAEIEAALAKVEPEFIAVLEEAAANIRAFHSKQVRNSFILADKPGVILGQRVIPLEKVGLYVPGGTAAYPSTVLMDAIPAKIAGVEEIVMVTPPNKEGSVNPYILAAAHVAGVGRIFKVGGAQAVAARTFACRQQLRGKHPDADVCTESACCQACLSEEQLRARLGDKFEAAWDKASAAVQATEGEVLTYDGALIEATYFSCSGGSTEDAAAVWGTEFPYLQAVASPGEEKAAHYTDTVRFSVEAFQNALGVTLSGSPGSWFRDVTYTDGGGVDTIVIGGTTYRGTELRSLLGLRSTAFSVSTTEDTVTVTTRGYGHRVGMSQYGADAMAVTGSTCPEILAHYYPGTTLTKLG